MKKIILFFITIGMIFTIVGMSSSTFVAHAYVLFTDNFDSGTMSPEWVTVHPTQWVAGGWLHNKDTNGWPRDSLAVVHDNDEAWMNYSVEAMVDFVPSSPWNHANLVFRSQNYDRSSDGSYGAGYQLTFYGAPWEFEAALSRMVDGTYSQLSRVPVDYEGEPFHVKITVEGANIEVEMNRNLIMTVDDPEPLLYGGIGVHNVWESEARYDYVRVNTLETIIRVPTPEYPTIQAGLDAASGGDTVLLADGTYTGAGNKNLVIGDGITLKSENGPDNCIIDCEFDGSFDGLGDDSASVIEGLTIKNGYSRIHGVIRIGFGGAIINCIVTNNSGTGIWGIEGSTIKDSIITHNSDWGVWNNDHWMHVENCIISNNGAGIGMYDGYNVDIVNCTINENTGWGVEAGVIGDVNITNSTIHGNESGVRIDAYGTITNSTISDNTNVGVKINFFESITINNSTISGNLGGGIAKSGGEVNLINSIVANNSNDDCSGDPVISLGHNLDSDGTCNLTKPNDIPNTNPLLGEFTDDGAPGRGHFPLLEGSPAIDKGNDDACPSTDQLGNPRVDGDGDGEIDCDIGAIEYQGQSVVFLDVSPGYWAEDSIYKIYEAGITKGCSQNPLMFCPRRTVKRSVAAVLIGRAKHGSSFTPPPATGIFPDVPVTHWFADWMEQFYNDGITKGCQQNPLMFCPDKPLTRAAAAVLLLRAKHGSSYVPPIATGIFDDIPLSCSWADWAEQLYREGITNGCQQNPLKFCPEREVRREVMAVFLVRAFGLTLGDGLVASYPFNGNANDESGNGNHGTILGAALTEDRFGNANSAYEFDGVDDYIEMLGPLSIGELTFSVWVISDVYIGRQNGRIFTIGNEIAGHYGHYYAMQGNSGYALSLVIDREKVNEYDWSFLPNTWTHIVMTYNGQTLVLYKDGVLTESGIIDSDPVSGPLFIGGVPEGDVQWDGGIDDVRIYNRILSEDEIKALYNLGN